MRTVIGGMVALGLIGAGPSALAHPQDPVIRPTQDLSREMEADEFFANYDTYLKLARSERAHYRLAYYVMTDQRPATGISLFLRVRQDVRPLRVAENGRVLDLPRPSEMLLSPHVLIKGRLARKTVVEARLEPDWDASPEMAISSLLLALQEAQAGEKKGAGLLGFAVPKLDRIYFRGVSQGEVVRGDGRSRPLPKSPSGSLMLIFADNPRAVSVRFLDAPTSMDIGAAPGSVPVSP